MSASGSRPVYKFFLFPWTDPQSRSTFRLIYFSVSPTLSVNAWSILTSTCLWIVLRLLYSSFRPKLFAFQTLSTGTCQQSSCRLCPPPPFLWPATSANRFRTISRPASIPFIFHFPSSRPNKSKWPVRLECFPRTMIFYFKKCAAHPLFFADTENEFAISTRGELYDVSPTEMMKRERRRG